MAVTDTLTTPATLLDAVNALLLAVRISNVMSLNAADLNEDASGALDTITKVAREVQLRGYGFNTEQQYAIDPGTDGSIVLPANTAKVRSARCGTKRLVQRGLMLYDATNHTFNIGETVWCDLVVYLGYNDMPESFKLYVTALAARRWCLPKLPAQATFSYTAEMVASAQSLAEEDDSESQDATLKETSPHFGYQAGRGGSPTYWRYY